MHAEPDDILVARLVDKERTYVSVVMFRKYHHNIDVISIYDIIGVDWCRLLKTSDRFVVGRGFDSHQLHT